MFDIPFIWEENEIYGLLLHQLKYLYEIESDNEDSIIQNYIINANSENSIDEIKNLLNVTASRFYKSQTDGNQIARVIEWKKIVYSWKC